LAASPERVHFVRHHLLEGTREHWTLPPVKAPQRPPAVRAARRSPDQCPACMAPDGATCTRTTASAAATNVAVPGKVMETRDIAGPSGRFARGGIARLDEDGLDLGARGRGFDIDLAVFRVGLDHRGPVDRLDRLGHVPGAARAGHSLDVELHPCLLF